MTARRRRRDPRAQQPLYARLLRLHHLHPSSLWCFLFLEGSVALAVLMALAEFVNWWAVVVLPLTIAGFVKINDVVTGVFAKAEIRRRQKNKPQQPRRRPSILARGVARVPLRIGGERPPSTVPGARRDDPAPATSARVTGRVRFSDRRTAR